MDFNADEIAALDADAQRIGVFFRLEVDPVLRLWLGLGPCEPGVNTLDPVGATYLGAGKLLNVSDFDHLINGAAQRVEFALSGVSDDVQAQLTVAANTVRDRPVALGLGIMGPDWQLLGAVRWCWRGYGDYLSADRTSEGAEAVQTVTLSAGTLMTGRRRGRNAYFTDQDQQRRSPGDRFCERTGLYREEVRKVWPRF
jgi:hypothetical protein